MGKEMRKEQQKQNKTGDTALEFYWDGDKEKRGKVCYSFTGLLGPRCNRKQKTQVIQRELYWNGNEEGGAKTVTQL